MIRATDIYNEIKIFKAFFEENSTKNFKDIIRSWKYYADEKSFLANRQVCIINTLTGDGILYDYSNILEIGVDNDNYKNYDNKYGVKQWNIPNKEMTKEKLKEILANNAKVLAVAEKYNEIINMRMELDKEFS